MPDIYDPQHKQDPQKVSNIQIDITKSYIWFCFIADVYTINSPHCTKWSGGHCADMSGHDIYNDCSSHTVSAVLDITVHGANVIGTPLIHIKYPYAAQQRQI